MYKRILIMTMLSIFMSIPVWAQDLKIGVVDLQEVLEKSEPGQKAISELKDRFKDMKSELDEKKSELEKMREEIKKQSLVLSQEAQIDKQTEYKQKVRDFQDLYQNYQRKMKLKEEKLREPIIETLVEVVNEYGDRHGFSLIMDKQNSGVIYNTDTIEITGKIISKVNESWEKKQKSLN